jgi:hypothetical protein
VKQDQSSKDKNGKSLQHYLNAQRGYLKTPNFTAAGSPPHRESGKVSIFSATVYFLRLTKRSIHLPVGYRQWMQGYSVPNSARRIAVMQQLLDEE